MLFLFLNHCMFFRFVWSVEGNPDMKTYHSHMYFVFIILLCFSFFWTVEGNPEMKTHHSYMYFVLVSLYVVLILTEPMK